MMDHFYFLGSGFRFPIKELGGESHVIQLCVNKLDVNLAIRYDSLFSSDFFLDSIVIDVGIIF